MTASTSSVTSRTTTWSEGDEEWVLPVDPPYGDTYTIDDTMVLQRDADGTVTLAYFVIDEFGGECWTEDELFHGWKHKIFHSQRDADEGSEIASAAREAGRPIFLIERYEHGQVCYALQGESSAVDRQWDVTGVAGIMVPDDDWGADTDLEAAARQTLSSFTDWCNGTIFEAVRATYKPGEYSTDDYETCGGILVDIDNQKPTDFI